MVRAVTMVDDKVEVDDISRAVARARWTFFLLDA
jgi:hypothetical protein